jgi:hypothetical protein
LKGKKEVNMQQKTIDTGHKWKLALGLLVGVFLIGTTASLFSAASRASRVVDPDYYNHGLHYGQTGKGAKDPGLGWIISASLVGAELRVRVSDQSGAPVGGGKLSFEPAPGREPIGTTIALAESAPGNFHAPRPASPLGELHRTLHFTRGDAAASHRLVLFN